MKGNYVRQERRGNREYPAGREGGSFARLIYSSSNVRKKFEGRVPEGEKIHNTLIVSSWSLEAAVNEHSPLYGEREREGGRC